MIKPDVNDYQNDDEGEEDYADYGEDINTFDIEDDGDDEDEES